MRALSSAIACRVAWRSREVCAKASMVLAQRLPTRFSMVRVLVAIAVVRITPNRLQFSWNVLGLENIACCYQ